MSTHPTGWLSYDAIVETYEHAAVPVFTPMAAELVSAVGLMSGWRVLDVGTGTGLVAGLAGEAIGSADLVIGVDPSLGMLKVARSALRIKVARSARRITVLEAKAPGLPFRNEAFDAITANLVLSHLSSLDAGLADMARVLVRGGRLGATAWGPSEPLAPDDQGQQADEVVAAVRDECGLPARAPEAAAPWEAELRDPERLCDLLTSAGLVEVAVNLHSYRRTMSIADFLAGWGCQGRYLRHVAGEQRWRDFVDLAAARLRDRFGNSVLSVMNLWVITGTKP